MRFAKILQSSQTSLRRLLEIGIEFLLLPRTFGAFSTFAKGEEHSDYEGKQPQNSKH